VIASLAGHTALFGALWGVAGTGAVGDGGTARRVVEIGRIDPADVFPASEARVAPSEETAPDPVLDVDVEPPTALPASEADTAPASAPELEPPVSIAVLGPDALRAPPMAAVARPSPAPPPRAAPATASAAPAGAPVPAAAGRVVVVRRVEPAYPASLRGLGVSGRVVVHVLVDAEGRVVDLRVAASSGVDAFDASASEALRGWRFEPRPTAFWASIPVSFSPSRS
jgi:periplasmic protein TonB